MHSKYNELISTLQSLSNPANVAGMARFGINPHNTLGVSVKQIRTLAKGLRDHGLALQLWASGIHEARILASLVDDPKAVTEEQMETWVSDFDSWDVCDQVCSNLFDRTPYAIQKVHDWTARPEEFVKRAGFVLIAALAMHQKKAPDQLFIDFFPIIIHEANDPRNFVRKAVNWALRGIGKRNESLRLAALQTAQTILAQDTPSARWIARDAIRELENRKMK